MISPLAELIANRGRIKRTRVGGVLVHTTGSGIVDRARRAGADPEALAVEFYARGGPAYPHYLVSHDGSTYSFCDEMRWAAHAAWSPGERATYGFPDWMRHWEDTIGGGVRGVPVEPSFYAAWTARWRARGLAYGSPREIVEHVGGAGAVPNGAYLGIEMLDAKPFTPAQHRALAALFADICRRHKLLDPRDIRPGTLPQAWLATHSDLSPQRRWQRTAADRKRGGVPREGFPWDCRTDQLDWREIERLLAAG